jgi:hypothetical protein
MTLYTIIGDRLSSTQHCDRCKSKLWPMQVQIATDASPNCDRRKPKLRQMQVQIATDASPIIFRAMRKRVKVMHHISLWLFDLFQFSCCNLTLCLMFTQNLFLPKQRFIQHHQHVINKPPSLPFQFSYVIWSYRLYFGFYIFSFLREKLRQV